MATLGRGGSDLTATLLGRALGAPRGLALEGRPRPAHRRSAGRPRRARHPAAAPARGGRARLLRRQGAAPARAHPGRGAAHPGVRAPVRRSARGGDRDLGAPHARQVPGQGAVGGVGGQALVTVGGQRHAGRPRHRGPHLRGAAPRGDQRLADLAVVVGAVDLLLGARGRGPARARAPHRGVPRPDRAARRSTASRSRPASPRSRWSGIGHGGSPRHRGAGVRGARAGGDQHRRDRAGLVGAEHLVRRRGQGRGAPRSARCTTPSSSPKIGGGAATPRHPPRRRAARLRADRPRPRRDHGASGATSKPQAAAGGGDRHQGLRVRSERPDRRRRSRALAAAKQAGRSLAEARGRAAGHARRRAVVPRRARARQSRSWST